MLINIKKNLLRKFLSEPDSFLCYIFLLIISVSASQDSEYYFFLFHSNIIHSYWDVTITGEELQILTYARHSWPLSSEGSIACHTYCDTGLPFIMVISEDLWHSHLSPSVWQWNCHYLFLRLRSVATWDRTPISRTRGERSTSTPPHVTLKWFFFLIKTSIL